MHDKALFPCLCAECKNIKRASATEQPLPLIPSAPVELLSSLAGLGSSQERSVCDCVNVKQGDAETELVCSVNPWWIDKNNVGKKN